MTTFYGVAIIVFGLLWGGLTHYFVVEPWLRRRDQHSGREPSWDAWHAARDPGAGTSYPPSRPDDFEYGHRVHTVDGRRVYEVRR